MFLILPSSASSLSHFHVTVHQAAIPIAVFYEADPNQLLKGEACRKCPHDWRQPTATPPAELVGRSVLL
jgi:hypothetical protein